MKKKFALGIMLLTITFMGTYVTASADNGQTCKKQVLENMLSVNKNCDLQNIKDILKELGVKECYYKFGVVIWVGNCEQDTDQETEKPEATETPDNNDQETEKPETTETPDNNDQETERPEVTETPDNNDQETEKPEITETPDNNDQETERPEVTETPDNNDQETEKPETTETPDDNNQGTENDDTTEVSYSKKVVVLVNKEREKEGLAPLNIDKNVELAANVRAKEIQTSFSHTRPNGSSFSTVLKENGVKYRGAGENIAWGQRTPEEVVSAWMNSPSHRANIMNSNYKNIGVGNVQKTSGVQYWVQLFTY